MTTKGERTRRRILDVVVHLLETRSFEEVSIAEITRRAEVTRPAFYFHFATKGAAVAAVLEDLLEEFVAVAAAWYERPGTDPGAGVAEALEATVALWREHARLMDAILRAASTDAEAAQLVDAWVAHLAARAADRMRRDLGDRLPAAGPSVEALAELMVGATVEAMRRDVRRLVATGERTGGVARTLAFVWSRVVAATPASE